MIRSDYDSKFIEIKDHKLVVEQMLMEIEKKVGILEGIYKSYLLRRENDDESIMSLDTLNFQGKLISIECNNYATLHKLFINRMYGQYYKLYKNITIFIRPYITQYKLSINIDEIYETYKDLETHTVYDFDLIEKIYTNILEILSTIYKYTMQEEYKISQDLVKTKKGININNFVYHKQYYLYMIEKRIKLYYNILNNYIDFQNKYFDRISRKLKLIYIHIAEDIKLETEITDDFIPPSNYTDDDVTTEINKFKGPSTIANWKILVRRSIAIKPPCTPDTSSDDSDSLLDNRKDPQDEDPQDEDPQDEDPQDEDPQDEDNTKVVSTHLDEPLPKRWFSMNFFYLLSSGIILLSTYYGSKLRIQHQPQMPLDWYEFVPLRHYIP